MKLIAVLQGPARLMRNQTLRTLESGSMVIGLESDAQQLAGADVGDRRIPEGAEGRADRLSFRVGNPWAQGHVDLGQPAHLRSRDGR